MTNKTYGRIKAVAEDSLAWEAGLEAGDLLVSINGQPVRDILEYNYLCLEDELTLEILRDGELLETEIELYDEDLGIEFEDDLFDGLRSCRNNCVFCFLHQMPKGMRKSLYVRDDDYRLSLAHGNYVTLTNVSDEELRRICDQKMSPIYISVQASEPELRAKLLRNESAGRIMEQLRVLAESRIRMNTQVVLCRGINDGEHLRRTISDLSSLHPWVESIGVVPVGLTKYRENLFPLQSFDRESAQEVVGECSRWQKRLKAEKGTHLVYPSDEFYLLSGKRLPSAASYEGFPQLENGIGLSRVFIDELRWVRRWLKTHTIRPGRYVLVTGTLATPLVEDLAEIMSQIEGVKVRVCTVLNKFFGESVTVTGLLTGQDVQATVAEASQDEEVLIPEVMLNEDRFLDDIMVSGLRSSSKAQITVVPTFPREMIKALASDERSR